MASTSVARRFLPCLYPSNESLLCSVNSLFHHRQTRHFVGNKHWNPKWKLYRARKVLKVDLPDYTMLRKELRGQLTPEEMRSHMKKEGIQPTRKFMERPMMLTATDVVFEPFVPPEGDGRMSLLSKTGALQAKDILTKRARSQWSLRRIRTFEEDFELTGFIPLSQEVYIKAHESLMSLDMDTLRDYVTEKAMAEMTAGMESKTVRWKFHEMIELPRVSQVRATHIMQKSNYYAQITVRMHSRQSLAIYDRFGRLMYGNEDRVKDVLEYVVFERHLADPHGKWRVHAKIVPDWMPARDPIIATYRKPRIGDLKPSEDWLKKQAEKSKIKGEEGDAPPEEPGAPPPSGKSDAESRKQQVAIA